MMEFLIEYGPLRLYWEPAEVFYKLSCVQLLLQLTSIACDWRTYYGRYKNRSRLRVRDAEVTGGGGWGGSVERSEDVQINNSLETIR